MIPASSRYNGALIGCMNALQLAPNQKTTDECWRNKFQPDFGYNEDSPLQKLMLKVLTDLGETVSAEFRVPCRFEKHIESFLQIPNWHVFDAILFSLCYCFIHPYGQLAVPPFIEEFFIACNLPDTVKSICTLFNEVFVKLLDNENVTKIVQSIKDKKQTVPLVSSGTHTEASDANEEACSALLTVIAKVLPKAKKYDHTLLGTHQFCTSSPSGYGILGMFLGALHGDTMLPRNTVKSLRHEQLLSLIARRLLGSSMILNPAHHVPYRGCYWVIPKHLLAGPYPGNTSEIDAAAALTELMKTGVTGIIDLTPAGELPPYALPEIEPPFYFRIPIEDFTAPSNYQMKRLAGICTGWIAAGDVLYVHCHAGIGRTGTVIACFLKDYFALSGDECLAYVRSIHQKNHIECQFPESFIQRKFIQEWTGDIQLVND